MNERKLALANNESDQSNNDSDYKIIAVDIIKLHIERYGSIHSEQLGQPAYSSSSEVNVATNE